jgi:phospholipase/carboxylesterase
MDSKRYQGNHLNYLVIHPDNYTSEADYPMVMLLHGFGASMADLAGLSPAINREGYIYACPNAPMPFDLGSGMVGYGWMPPRGAATPEDVQNAEKLLEGFFQEVMEQYHIKPGNVVLGGFSQGGGMTYRCGLGQPETFAGLFALSGFLANPEDLRPKLPSDHTQPIFIAHGSQDDVAPVEGAQKARDFLEEVGYSPQYKEYSMRHEISPEVMADLVPWIKAVLPPFGR